MNIKIAFAAAAVTVSSFGAITATAMDMEHNMLTGAVFNELRARSLDTSVVPDLTLGQIARITSCKNSGESEGKIQECIKAAIRNVDG